MSKLADNLFTDKVEMDPTRMGFGRGLLEAGKRNDKVVALCADLTDSTKISLFRDEFPERFIQMGIAEQNLATVASGLARMGHIPFAASYAAFSPGRNWEQIKTTAALNDVPVKIVGAHAGLYTGKDGATHQMLEDIAIMRAMPNMMVVVPGDAVEAEKATLAVAESKSPTYIRVAREATPVFTTPETSFSLDKALVLRKGKDVSLVGTGTMTYKCLEAAEMLAKEGVEAEVVHVAVIKPLDEVTIIETAKKTGLVVTAEEAQITGGLGGAVAELLSEELPTKVVRIGVRDRFGESGDPAKLFEEHEMTAKHIFKKVNALFDN